ncbi:hypothetical protein L249_4365 [Ophiocordyceps polyrhachis-furcata BCC 54312]|uniref:Uncharacterized protein n=1 Tax=Ophiocordyceps polyrhachis-furcata BCC 54312 TaxID=1330021 RepID=A0A367L7D7_9HYPO|nr:hypothetical protein L249_4365 [Ophiocordyceps polyrhachis-furcata BCC 54312]
MQRIYALDNRLRIISAIPAGGDLSVIEALAALPYKILRKGSKADFAIMHERLAYASKEKVIQACRKAGITAFTEKILDIFDADNLKPTKTPWPSRYTIPYD